MIRIKTGIEGLDKMLSGGLIAGRPYLVSGSPGSGKTIFGIQFLMEGLKEGEGGVYVSLEERAKNLKENMEVFGWNIEKIDILEATPEVGSDIWEIKTDSPYFDMNLNLRNLIETLKQRTKPDVKRIVVDSITSLKIMYSSDFEARREMLAMMQFLQDTQCTTLLLAETFGEEHKMESFLADGVINLHILTDKGIKRRAIEIQKMRGSSFDEQLRPMKITEKGIVVYPEEALFKQ